MTLSRREMLLALGAGIVAPEFFGQAKRAWGAEGVKLKALGLCIGLDQVNTATGAYAQNWDSRLHGCVNDAITYETILQKKWAHLGAAAKVLPLHTEHATTAAVAQHILGAAELLEKGGLFVITYSGHGGQTRFDDSGDESDGRDETWCLYDRQLIDDELYRFWHYFREGVRIVLVSDSCHSATVFRASQAVSALRADIASPDSQIKRTLNRVAPMEAEASVRGLESRTRDFKNINPRSLHLRGDGNDDPETVLRHFRGMPADFVKPSFERGRKIYEGIRATYRESEVSGLGSMLASGIALAACQDKQLSAEFGGHGYFTSVLAKELAAAKNYEALIDKINMSTKSTQNPVFSRFGDETSIADFYKQEPFTV